MPGWKLGLSALVAAVALVACGGSDDNGPNRLRTAQLIVAGDSLSDSGTFYAGPGTARTFTVQGTDREPYVLWVEHLAQAQRLEPLCAAYRFDGQGFGAGEPGCSNYAIGGGRINNALGTGGAEAPLSILRQLDDASNAGWQADDLLVVDGGGNDMADLVTAYLGGVADEGAGYQQLLLTLLPEDVVTEELQREHGPERLGGLYLQTLADTLADKIEATALAGGVEQAVIINMPTVTFTPKFQVVLATIELAGPELRAEAEGLFRQWIDAFNGQLADRFADESRVLVVDVAGRFNAFMDDSALYGLSNVQIPVCGAEGFTQVPLRDFDECTADVLAATPPPAGAPDGRDWWQRFLFADSFHPTPYGHQLMGELVLESMDDAGWH